MLGVQLFAQTQDSIRIIQTRENKQNYEIKTIFNNDIDHGAYLGFGMGYSEIDAKDAWHIFGKLGWVIDHKITLGIAGYGFGNDMLSSSWYSEEQYLVGGYGGLFIEPVIASRFPVHVSFPVLFGVGGIAGYEHNEYNWEEDDYNYSNNGDSFWIIEPGMDIELNVFRCLRISGGVSYRHTSNIMLESFDNRVVSGLSTNFTIKLGVF